MGDRGVCDVVDCVKQAHDLARRMANIRRQDQGLRRAFASLAGDETVGLVAYIIWRSQSNQALR